MSTNGRLCPGEAVVVTNERGTILSVSPVFERFTGFNRYEVVGQRLRVNAKAPFGDSSADQAAAWACPTSECTQTGMVCYSKKDGTPFQVTAMISPLRGAVPRCGSVCPLDRAGGLPAGSRTALVLRTVPGRNGRCNAVSATSRRPLGAGNATGIALDRALCPSGVIPCFA